MPSASRRKTVACRFPVRCRVATAGLRRGDGLAERQQIVFVAASAVKQQ